MVAATAIRIAWSASRAVHGLGISRRATRRNASSSALYAASNRVEERGPGGSCQRRGVRLQRADRRPPVEADRHRIPRADDLHPDVVAEGVVAGLPEDRERAVGEGEDDRARVDVAVLREHGKPAHRARRVDLDDLLAGHPAQRVEVVDRGVPEQAAGDRDVRVGRRLVVAGRSAGRGRPSRARRSRPVAAPPRGPRRSAAGSRPGRPPRRPPPCRRARPSPRGRTRAASRRRPGDRRRSPGSRAWRGRSSTPRRAPRRPRRGPRRRSRRRARRPASPSPRRDRGRRRGR